MKSNSKVYVVMAGYIDSEHCYVHSVHKDKLGAESTSILVCRPDEDGHQDTYSYVTEAVFYDQDA